MENKNLNCPICKKDLFSSLGSGCKMCGMPLDSIQDFCCKSCMKKYNTINKSKRRWNE